MICNSLEVEINGFAPGSPRTSYFTRMLKSVQLQKLEVKQTSKNISMWVWFTAHPPKKQRAEKVYGTKHPMRKNQQRNPGNGLVVDPVMADTSRYNLRHRD